MEFKIIKQEPNSNARITEIKLAHGKVETPCFIPVGTKASVKTISSKQLNELNADMILVNTYHLQPFVDVIEKAGGINKFISYNKPVMTDSGGFQAFSLGFGMLHGVGKIGSYFPENNQLKKSNKSYVKIDNFGVDFISPYTGEKIKLTPEISIKLQEKIKADIILAFDECTSPFSDYEYTKKALKRTHNWAEECIDVHKTQQALFGIVQGGMFENLRKESAEFITKLNFVNY